MTGSYAEYLCRVKEAELSSVEAARQVATQGLDALCGTLEWEFPDGSRVPVEQAFDGSRGEDEGQALSSMVVKGTGKVEACDVTALCDEVQHITDNGGCDPSVVEAVRRGGGVEDWVFVLMVGPTSCPAPASRRPARAGGHE